MMCSVRWGGGERWVKILSIYTSHHSLLFSVTFHEVPFYSNNLLYDLLWQFCLGMVRIATWLILPVDGIDFIATASLFSSTITMKVHHQAANILALTITTALLPAVRGAGVKCTEPTETCVEHWISPSCHQIRRMLTSAVNVVPNNDESNSGTVPKWDW